MDQLGGPGAGAAGRPDVADAAVVAVPHHRWQERPLAVVVLRAGAEATGAELLARLEERVPRWWLPEDVVVVDALPRTSVGKTDKRRLRTRYARTHLITTAPITTTKEEDMAFLEVEDGKRVYYEHHTGAGRPVVLVHGWGVTSRCWDTTLPALRAAGHAVVTIDHRACGRSDKDFADTSIAAIASDVVALVEHLGLRAPVLNGWSLGGAVAIEAAPGWARTSAGWCSPAARPRATRRRRGGPTAARPPTSRACWPGWRADRASTFRAVADAVCVKPVGRRPSSSRCGCTFMETGPRADDTLRDLAGIDQREILPTLPCRCCCCAAARTGSSRSTG